MIYHCANSLMIVAMKWVDLLQIGLAFPDLWRLFKREMMSHFGYVQVMTLVRGICSRLYPARREYPLNFKEIYLHGSYQCC